MFLNYVGCLLLFFINSSILFGQQIDDNFIAGKWKVEEVIVPENKFKDKREKKILEELGKTVLHFKGDGHFLFIYDGNDKELIRNIEELGNSRWSTIDGENAILLEKGAPLIVMPVEISESIVIEFFNPIRLRVSKIEDEKVSFSPKPDIIVDEQAVTEHKIDSVFKHVAVEKRSLEDSVVTEYPVLEGCEGKKGSSCLNKVIRNSIVDALDLKKYRALVDQKRIKVFVSFAIDTDGVVKNIKAKSVDDELTYDLKLIINNIKVITPAKNADGESMLSTYAIPLTLMVQ